MPCIMRTLLLLLGGAMPLMAGFSKTVQSVSLDYGQKQVVLTFESDTPIRKAKALCECTKVSFEGTKLTARVDTTAFSQDVEKQIDATTADGVTTRLTMRFSVPQALLLSSRTIIWKQGGPAQTKELRIRIPAGSPVRRLGEASLSGDAFEYTPRIVKDGAEYVVSITPHSTEKKLLNRLILKTDSADPRYSQHVIYLSIQPL